MAELDGKVAVVTGGASGIGEATVRQFVEEGAKVVIHGLEEEWGKELVEELGAPAVLPALPLVCVRAAGRDLVVVDPGCVWNEGGGGRA